MVRASILLGFRKVNKWKLTYKNYSVASHRLKLWATLLKRHVFERHMKVLIQHLASSQLNTAFRNLVGYQLVLRCPARVWSIYELINWKQAAFHADIALGLAFMKQNRYPEWYIGCVSRFKPEVRINNAFKLYYNATENGCLFLEGYDLYRYALWQSAEIVNITACGKYRKQFKISCK
jgi:hypothetical protein